MNRKIAASLILLIMLMSGFTVLAHLEPTYTNSHNVTALPSDVTGSWSWSYGYSTISYDIQSPVKSGSSFTISLSDVEGTPSESYDPYTVTITDTTTGGSIGSMTFGVGGKGSTQTASGTFTAPGQSGSNTLSFQIKAYGNGDTSTYTASFTVLQPISVSISDSSSTIDAGQSISFTSSVSGGETPYSYSWNFGDGGSSSSANPSHTYSNSGTYTVKLTVSGSAGQTSSASLTVTVEKDPSVSISPSSKTIDAGQSVSFTSTVNYGKSPYSYSWTISGTSGTASTGTTLDHTFSSQGTYTITLKVTDSLGETASASSTVTVNPDPVSSISTSSQNIDSGQSVSFSGSGSGGTGSYSYSWYISGSKISTASSFTHQFNSSGTYTIELYITDSLGVQSDAATVSITVNPDPVLTASSNVSQADIGFPVEFSSSVSGGTGPYTYSWTLNGNQVSTGSSFSYSFSASGSYVLDLTVTDSAGISRSTSVSVTVNNNPAASISASSTTIDAGQSIQLTGSSQYGTGTITYNWLVNGSSISNSYQTSYTFNKAGIYEIELIVTDGDNHQGTAFINITVNVDPTVTIYPVLSQVDAGLSDQFKATIQNGTGPFNYTWMVNSAIKSYSNSPNLTFQDAFTYNITLKLVDASGFVSYAYYSLSVNPDPVAKIYTQYLSPDANVNDTFTAQVSGGTYPFTYQWFLNGSIVNQTSKFTDNFSSPGVYEVILNVTDSLGLFSVSFVNITVLQDPSTAILGSNQTDANTTTYWRAYASNGTAPYQYYWWVNGQNITSGFAFSYSFSGVGEYNITLHTIDSNGYRTTAYKIITVNQKPQVSITESHDPVDSGVTISLKSVIKGGTGPFNYTWTIDGYQVGSEADLNYTFYNSGLHTIYLFLEDGMNQVSTQKITIKVIPDPSVAILPEYSSIDANMSDLISANVSNGEPSYAYSWSINGNHVSDSENFSHIFSSPGTYELSVTVKDAFGIQAYSTYSIIVTKDPQGYIVSGLNKTDAGVPDNLRASVNYGTGPYSYQWIIAGNKYNGESISPSFSDPGNYTVQLIVSDSLGQDSVSDYNVTVFQDPQISIEYKNQPEVAVESILTANITRGIGPYNIQWYFSSGQQESGSTVNHVFSYAGFRSFQVHVSDHGGFSRTYNFTANVSLYVSISASSSKGFAPLSVNLYSSVLGASSYSYHWNFGNGNTSVLADPSQEFGIGNYTVTLSVLANNGATGSASIQIDSLPSPVIVSYSPNSNITVNTPVTFNAEPNWNAGNRSLANASWYFPNGATLHGLTVNFTFPVYNEFNTVLVNFTYDNGKSVNKEIQVRMVPAKPIARISGVSGVLSLDSLLVLNASNSYSPDASIINYLWTINGQSYSGENAMYYLNETGNYTVSLTVMDSLGASSTTYSSFAVVKPGTSNQISIATDSYSSGNLIHLNITASSSGGIENLQVLYQGASVPVTLDRYNNTTSHYSLVIDQAAYTSGTHRLEIIAYNFNLQSNYTHFVFSVSSQYGKQGFNIVSALGGEQNFLIVVFSAIGSISTLISVLYGIRSRNTTVLDVDGQEFKATPGKPLVAVGKRRKEKRSKL